jgi:cell fate (sporulation/competence/biofilm development) regulator YlbF (YheA/YmcA/DUF963 family)
MKNTKGNLPEELVAATEELSEYLLAAEPFIVYKRAQNQFNVDVQARSLLEQLSTLQSSLRSAQSNRNVSETDIQQLRALQNEVRQNTTIMEYSRAQQSAINYLREINQEISQLLGLDFAALARQSTC